MIIINNFFTLSYNHHCLPTEYSTKRQAQGPSKDFVREQELNCSPVDSVELIEVAATAVY
jgi:hypothetical protein